MYETTLLCVAGKLYYSDNWATSPIIIKIILNRYVNIDYTGCSEHGARDATSDGYANYVSSQT
jgi:hypothetical protein